MLDLGFYVDGFCSAFLGGLVDSTVGLVLSLFTGARQVKIKVESHASRI